MKKTKILSLLLVAVLLAGGCTSVNTPEPLPDENAISSSVDVSSYTKWLADRLNAKADGNEVTLDDHTVTLAVGDNVMGVDTAGIRNEGYIIRSENDSTVIVAKTETGADKAVHKFANEYEKTGSASVNVFEGLKIGRILLGGTDIKNYKILLPKAPEGDDSFAASATPAMDTAANELSKYIGFSVGHALPVEYVVGLHTMTDDEIKAQYGNAIVLLSDPTAKSASRLDSETGEMGTEDHRLTVSDGIMRIVGGNQRGCLYGVYDFLENHVGWRFLGKDMDYIYDATELDINDIDEYFSPSFEYRGSDFSSVMNEETFVKVKYNSFNSFPYAQSAKYGYGFGSTLYHGHSFYGLVPQGMTGSHPQEQPCLSDKEVLAGVIGNMCKLLEERMGPPWNAKIGYDHLQIACSMNDNFNYCKCPDCMSEMRRTSFSNLYFNFVNEAAKVIGEKFPGVLVNTVAYQYARTVPEEVVLEPNVSVYYCAQGCNQHSLCDGLCANYPITSFKGENVSEKKNLDAWAKVCDNVYLWHYTTSFISALSPCPNVYELYDDITYCASIGLMGFYSDGDHDHNFENLKAYLIHKLTYNANVTREEFFAMIDEYITIVYGEDSAPYIREYLDMHQQSGEAIDGCFTNNYHYPFDMMDKDYFIENYDTMKELFENALRFAKDTKTEHNIEKLRLHVDFMGLSATYERDYVNGSEESRKMYEDAYKKFVDTTQKYQCEIEIGQADTWPTGYELDCHPMLKFFSGFTTISKENRA
ncbi:MAG: DUF4838 domain-containing protein [Ruminococcaceae bacterium]|nr:DUF4838 domain-containing protein [Oscillospiraceae bacterium]